jgi:hypothetical protein
MPVDSAVRMLLHLATQLVAAGTPPIAWTVDPGLTCPTEAQLESAYRGEAASRTESSPPDLVVSVEITPSAGGVVRVALAAEPLGLKAEREIDAHRNRCEDVALTVAILVDAWLRDLPETSTPLAAPETVTGGEAPMAAPLTQATEVSAVVRPSPRPSKLGLDLRVAGGLWIASGAAVAPSVTVSAELDVSSLLGVALFASFQGNLSVDDAPAGSLLLHQQLFGALATFAIPGMNRLGVRGLTASVLAGVVLWHGTAQSFGYPISTSSEQLRPGLTAGGRLEQRIAGPLFLDLQTSFIFLNRSLNLEIDRLGGTTATLATLPTFALDVSLGMGIKVL